MPSGVRPRRAAAAVRHTLAARSAFQKARRYARRTDADVIVCWDLDNTLVDSGSLLRQGMSLAEAVAVAEPMARMLEFFADLAEAIPDAEHVVLSARPRSLRPPTIEWLARHGLRVAENHVWLVPDAQAKLTVWRCLVRSARLVIIDDLSYGHEGDVRAPYGDLVDAASAVATVYVGLSEIAAVGVDSFGGKRVAASVVERLDRIGADASLAAAPATVEAARA